MRAGALLGDLRQDLRHAARTLSEQRVFGGAALLILALGIGANSAMFALVDAILLRPLPFPAPGSLAMIWESTAEAPRDRVSPLNLRDWRERSRTFETMAGYIPNVGGMVMAGADGSAETVPRQWVSSGVFDVLGVRPVVGRTFRPEDDRRGTGVVVLAEDFWRTRFAADPGIVGRDLRLDGEPFTVVGVVPREAQLIGRSSLWALAADAFPATGGAPEMRGAHFARAIGRLRPGVALPAAAGDLAGVAAALAREHPATNRGRGVTVEPLHDAVVGRELRLTSILFLGVVGLVLLLCSANVANLLLTRATVRRRELALRSALGASRSRLVRQLLTESLLLAVAGGALGVVVGRAILAVAPSFVPPDLLPAGVALAFDARVLAFCAATALAVGFLFGLAPAWQATDLTLAPALAAGSRIVAGRAGRAGRGGRGGRTRGGLVVGQVATAVVLLFAAGLLLRTLANLATVDRGYRAESVLTMTVDALDDRHDGEDGLLRFYEAIEREVRSLSGVGGVAWASTLPMGTSYEGQSYFEIVGDPPVEESRRPAADYQVVSAAYFATLDLPVVQGRGFDARDRRDGVQVCLVNEAFVRGHLRGRSPLGARIAIRPTGAPEAAPVVREIVGVARQVKGRPDETEDLLQIYVPLTQDTPGDIFLVVRPESGPAGVLARPVQAAIGGVDREQLAGVRNVMTLSDVAAEATARHRFRAALVVTFAVLALALSMAGVFGVLAYTVEQRVRDFGVRRALGATTGDVLRLVAGSAARLVATGMVLGLGLALALGRLLGTLLFGVQTLDVPTFAAVAVVLALTAAVAIAEPALRAARVDPAEALRAE
jgi:putative ABC transport system permease protein